jgi:hypothetical protein
MAGWTPTLTGIPCGDVSPGDATACRFEKWSGRSPNDLRFKGEMTGGGIGMSNMVSAARRH